MPRPEFLLLMAAVGCKSAIFAISSWLQIAISPRRTFGLATLSSSSHSFGSQPRLTQNWKNTLKTRAKFTRLWAESFDFRS